MPRLMFPLVATFVAMTVTLLPNAASAQVQLSSQQWHQRVDRQLTLAAARGGNVKTIGTHPKGYGKTFVWDRKDKQVTLIMFINAADDLGVAVTNVKPGDTIEVTSAAGMSSFDDGKGKLISSLVGAAAMVGTALAPEAAPFIAAGEKFAKDNFGTSNRDKERDSFGVDDDGDFQRCEGGVLICMPAAGGVYYSTAGCLKKHRPRTDDMRPDHVKHGFFLVRNQDKPGHNKRTVQSGGELYVVAWDRKFPDNQGFYKVFMRITRGN